MSLSLSVSLSKSERSHVSTTALQCFLKTLKSKVTEWVNERQWQLKRYGAWGKAGFGQKDMCVAYLTNTTRPHKQHYFRSRWKAKPDLIQRAGSRLAAPPGRNHHQLVQSSYCQDLWLLPEIVGIDENFTYCQKLYISFAPIMYSFCQKLKLKRKEKLMRYCDALYFNQIVYNRVIFARFFFHSNNHLIDSSSSVPT